MKLNVLRTTVIAGAALVASIFVGTITSSASSAVPSPVAASPAACTEPTRLDSNQYGTVFTQGVHLGDPAKGTTALYYGFENLTATECASQTRYQARGFAYIGKQNGAVGVRIDRILVTDNNGVVLAKTRAPLSSGDRNFVSSDTLWNGNVDCATAITMTVTFSVRWADGTLTTATRSTSSDHCWNR